MSFTIGFDPELFFKDKTDKLISVVGKIGGTKEEPMPIGEGCAIQEDNVAAEFCVPPATTVQGFIDSIDYALNDINKRAQALGLTIAQMQASGTFDIDQLKTRQARTFGCDPDYNAYTGMANPRPRTANKQLRSAGGHIHVGTQKNPFDVVKTLDMYIGVPSVLIDPDEERRKLYGKAGCLRIKPYGVEYRTPSNFWIWNHKTIAWVYHQVSNALNACDSYIEKASDELYNTVQHCINNNDKETAKRLVSTYGIIVP
jgi:hypothetical protein